MKKGHKKEEPKPSNESLHDIPEVDFSSARIHHNKHASRIAKEGIVVQIGRGRPRKIAEVGGTSPRSIRFPDTVWKLIEERAKDKGITVHAALREAVLFWFDNAA